MKVSPVQFPRYLHVQHDLSVITFYIRFRFSIGGRVGYMFQNIQAARVWGIQVWGLYHR
jgi:hypothetical protein